MSSQHDSEMLSRGQRSQKLLIHTFLSWSAQRCASKGAALAFYSLFSMAPVLVLMTSIVSLVFGKRATQGAIFEQLKEFIGANAAHTIQLIVKHTYNSHGGFTATVIALVTLLIGASSMFVELKSSLDELWEVPITQSSTVANWFKLRFLSFGLILALSLLLISSILFSAAILLLSKLMGGWWSELSLLAEPLSNLFSFVVIASLFAIIYKVLPHKLLSWQDVWIGAVGTAGLFSLGQYVIALYFSYAAGSSSYGAMGSIAIILLWIYYSAQIFFLGAAFTRQYALWFGSLCQKKLEKTTI